jgi:hypothetical protein
MLQIRVTDADGSNPIILEKADDKELTTAINSSDEGISFTIAKVDPKAEYVNPDNPATYQRLWECWDTEKGARKYHGPITEIDDDYGKYTVKGKGVSQFLVDMVKSTRTFYTSLGEVIDSLRFDNIAAQPKTSTVVSEPNYNAVSGIFGSIVVNEKYHALSKISKDYAIDDFDGVSYTTSDTEPSNRLYATDQFWAGMSDNDAIIIDLGEETTLNKVEIYFPWWGGITNKYNRSYSFELAYAPEGDTIVQGRPFGTFTSLYDTGSIAIPTTSYITEPGKALNIYTGNSIEKTFNSMPIYSAPSLPDIKARYLRVHITGVGAWYMGKFRGDYDPSITYDIGDVVRAVIPSIGYYISLHPNNLGSSFLS